ncbi:MAG: acylneuraminate cytidylyltransferase family protein [Elusimicrobiota bacterium]
MKILGLIPARGGSKSVLQKNIKLLAGKPLIAYTIEEAKKSNLINRIIVSSDDKEIVKISKKFGAEAPFLRPSHISQDDTPDLPVFQHVLKWLKKNENYIPDIIIHLRPTSPLRKVEHINSGIKLLLKNKSADSVRSICEPNQTPYKMWKIIKGYLAPLLNIKSNKKVETYNLPRQKLPKVYWQTASVDVIRYDTIMKKNSMTGDKILPLYIDEKYSIDLDTELDFKIAEEIIKSGVING